MKKLRILLLTLFMVFTILPINTIAEGEDQPSYEPDLSVYATKDDLMTKFTPNADGTAENIGKIVFGNKLVVGEKYEPAEWYILGQDSEIKDDKGVTIDNTVVFATNSIILPGKYKYSDGSEGRLYFASVLHYVLNDISNNTNFFSIAEKKIMNKTNITVEDPFAANPIQSGDCVLYALATNNKQIQPYIYAGTKDSITLSMSDYWATGNSFWLRTPMLSEGNYMLIASPESETGITISDDLSGKTYDYRPASNLNLTNVLFASAAKSDSIGAIASDAAMTLRFDGSGKNLGNVSYDNDNIYVNTHGDYTLIVQGRNGDQNWYYTFQTAGNNFKIKKNDIINDLKNNASNPITLTNIDLSKCKIWIERKEDGLIYAVEANKAINSVDITIDNTVAGGYLTANAKCNTTGIDSTAPAIIWSPNDETVDYSETYQASFTLTPKTGYVFLNLNTPAGLFQASAIVNGQTATSVNINDNGSMTVTYEFLKNIDRLVNVTNPNPITVDNGTSLEDIKKQLPSSVTVETVGKSVSSLEVNWLINEVTDYDPSNQNGRELKIKGTVELPKDGSILAISNDGPAVVEIQVIVKAAEIVPTPTPTSAPPSSISSTTDDGYVVPNTGVK